jgi:hypothetical protein
MDKSGFIGQVRILPLTSLSIAYYISASGVGGTGASTFLNLTDAPHSYVGQTGKGVRVNALEAGLEFFSISGGTDEKVGVDAAATPDYLGATDPVGALRVDSTLHKTDGGNFITLGVSSSFKSGSFSGSFEGIFTGSYFGTASWANSSSWTISASYALNAKTAAAMTGTASWAESSSWAFSSSTAISSAHADRSDIAASALTATSATTAYTASYYSGSSTAIITASLISLSFITASSITASFYGTFTGTSSWASKAISSSYILIADTASYVTTAQTASYISIAQSASYYSGSSTAIITASIINATSFTGSLKGTSSWVYSASQALTASYANFSHSTLPGLSSNDHPQYPLAYVIQEPTGITNKAESSISFDTASRTFNMWPASAGATFSYYITGSFYSYNTTQSVIFPNVDGTHWAYFRNSILTASVNGAEINFNRDVMVGNVYWNSTQSITASFGDERHGVVMDGTTHDYLHDTVGTRYASGLTIGNYTLTGNGSADADATCSFSDGVIWDEDLENSIANGNPQQLSTNAQLPILYLTQSGVWVRDARTNFPLKQGTNRIRYNSGSLWTTLDVSQGNYVATWVFATNDKSAPLIAVLGQRDDGTFANAQTNNTLTNLYFGTLPFAEMRLIYRLIFQTSTAYGNTPHARLRDVQDYRASSILPASIIIGGGSINVNTASYAISASYAVTASYVNTAETASYWNDPDNGTASYYSGSSTATITASAMSLSFVTASSISASFYGTFTGTSSWASKAITASYVKTADTASYYGGTVPASIPSLDQILDPTGDKSFGMTNKHIEFTYADPTSDPTYIGAFQIQAKGNYNSDVVYIRQVDGTPGVNDLVHIESENKDTTPLRIIGKNADYLTYWENSSVVVSSMSANGDLWLQGNVTAPSFIGTSSWANNVLGSITSASRAENAGTVDNLPSIISLSQITASYISMSVNMTASSITASFYGTFTGTSSWSSKTITASYVNTSETASFVTTAQTASFVTTAQTASYWDSTTISSSTITSSWLSARVMRNDTFNNLAASTQIVEATSGNLFLTANAAATSITTINGGFIGQQVMIRVNDAFTAFTHGANFFLIGTSSYTASNGDALDFVCYDGTIWYEIGRNTVPVQRALSLASFMPFGSDTPITLTPTLHGATNMMIFPFCPSAMITVNTVSVCTNLAMGTNNTAAICNYAIYDNKGKRVWVTNPGQPAVSTEWVHFTNNPFILFPGTYYWASTSPTASTSASYRVATGIGGTIPGYGTYACNSGTAWASITPANITASSAARFQCYTILRNS